MRILFSFCFFVFFSPTVCDAALLIKPCFKIKHEERRRQCFTSIQVEVNGGCVCLCRGGSPIPACLWFPAAGGQDASGRQIERGGERRGGKISEFHTSSDTQTHSQSPRSRNLGTLRSRRTGASSDGVPAGRDLSAAVQLQTQHRHLLKGIALLLCLLL